MWHILSSMCFCDACEDRHNRLMADDGYLDAEGKWWDCLVAAQEHGVCVKSHNNGWPQQLTPSQQKYLAALVEAEEGVERASNCHH